jgi:hypothetical protein
MAGGSTTTGGRTASLGYLTHLELSAALDTLRGGGRQLRCARLNLEIVGGSLSPPGAHQNTFWKANLHRSRNSDVTGFQNLTGYERSSTFSILASLRIIVGLGTR